MLQILLLFAACTVSEEDFPKQFAQEICGVEARCAKGSYRSSYGWNRGRCVDELTGEWEDFYAGFTEGRDCTFSEEEAATCLDGYSFLTCRAWYEGEAQPGCADVYSCE